MPQQFEGRRAIGEIDIDFTALEKKIDELIQLLSGKLRRDIFGIDEDGKQQQILVTPDGKVIVRITALDENGVQRVILVTEEGKVLIFGELDLVDSTTTPLAGAATYTSAPFSLLGYHKIVGTAIADQPGTLYIEQSQDGINWDLISSLPVNVDLTHPRGAGFQIDVLAPHGRVRYVNLATAQTVFRLYTHLRVI